MTQQEQDARQVECGLVHTVEDQVLLCLRTRSVREDYAQQEQDEALSKKSTVGPRASNFFAWQRRRSRRYWFYRRWRRMQSGGKRAARSQGDSSDRA